MHTYILRVWINGIQPQESRYRVSGIAVPENWNGGAIWAGFFMLFRLSIALVVYTLTSRDFGTQIK